MPGFDSGQLAHCALDVVEVLERGAAEDYVDAAGGSAAATSKSVRATWRARESTGMPSRSPRRT
jgi:hypothetical protein